MRVENVEVLGLEQSVRGSKYPMVVDTNKCNTEITDTVKKLANAEPGSGHDQFLTGIIVQFDLTTSLKMWTELQRYHFIDFISSQSTMHRICKFDIDKQVNDYVDKRAVDLLNELVTNYNNDKTPENYLKVLYNIPTGFQLTARLTTNYRQLKTVYSQRKNHRLPEWRDFCKWVETLPYAKEFILNEN